MILKGPENCSNLRVLVLRRRDQPVMILCICVCVIWGDEKLPEICFAHTIYPILCVFSGGVNCTLLVEVMAI